MREILLRRNIKYLMHFTRVENLQSILRKGLYPREELDEDSCIFNDAYRYDCCEMQSVHPSNFQITKCFIHCVWQIQIPNG